jgi:dTDP-4-amino-4,6-dideoxygalactose transaminase
LRFPVIRSIEITLGFVHYRQIYIYRIVTSNMNSNPIRSKENFLIFGAPAIEDAEIQEVVATMKTGWLGTGPKVMRFENEFKAYKGSEYAVAVNSCTAALHLSILAAGLKPGDEVITTPMTFCATVNAIVHAGATPVLADVDPVTMNIDPERVEAKITSKTKAILPVHFAGRPCDMDALCEIARRHNLKLLKIARTRSKQSIKGAKQAPLATSDVSAFMSPKTLPLVKEA